jgi:hypothetical protein
VFLFVPPEQRAAALSRIPSDRAHLVAERGGKALYSNQPVDQDPTHALNRAPAR